MSDDAELLRRYAGEGSEPAFAEFVARHIPLVYAAALRRTGGDAQHAADVAQQVFLAAAKHARSLARHASVTGWIYTATRNAALNLMRGEQRRLQRERAAMAASEILSPGENIEAEWDRLRPVLDTAMDELHERDREAVLLRFFEGRALAEIGARLGLSENTARMRVERALKRLESLLVRRGVTSTSAALTLALSNSAATTIPAGLAMNVTTTALAGAISTGATVGLLTFMTTNKMLGAALAALGILGVGIGSFEWSVARDAKAKWAAGVGQLEAANAKIARLEQQLGASERRTQSTISTRATTPLAAKVTGESAVRSIVGAAASLSPELRKYASPEYVELTLQKFRGEVGLKYGPLYKALGLSSDEIARFESALIEGMQSTLEVWSVAAAQGLSLNDPSIIRMTSAPSLARDQKVRELLGEARFDSYQQYDRTQSARAIVGTLAGNLYYTSAPLTGEQAEFLAKLVVGHSEQKKTPLAADREGKVIYSLSTETDWATVEAQSQGILAPEQLATLRVLAEQQQLQRRLNNFPASAAAAGTGQAASAGGASRTGG